ncbi:unnamed protein product [Rhizophagus irregularis]|nr:unnamed protein product [Rhizophagus irregularis]CAB4430821.1 unnamed protein product [Rhizophagus irregularis]
MTSLFAFYITQLLNQHQHIHQQIQLHEEDNSVFVMAVDLYVANHILKGLNSKISVMIAEAEAALNSKVEVTELEMILAEEKERDERIMKEFGFWNSNS